MDILIKILVLLRISYFISGIVALPLSQTSTAPPTKSPDLMEIPVVFTHDVNPFDPSSISFQLGSNLNVSKPSPDSISKSPIVKLHQVIPLLKLEEPLNPPLAKLNNTRQMRVHIFRPLFVYRQEQAMKNRPMDGRPSFDPDRFYYNYPYYHHYHHQKQQHQQHQYAIGYPDFYESYPFKNYDYVTNDLSADRFPTYDFWYP
ncbi:uncharacterized protein LOC129573605 [Sitodiplosis mosellana]|uniref:uncharacterized protein LOC129573605 n=1 Tax=Sitodiplosis mosellana TaxID=263140 RepID=UPI002444C306|nr:uncharacterized protein LOC129573605 [Sitodiplosis mosellana]